MDVLAITALLFLWNLAVIHYISKWFYNYFRKFEGIPTDYVGRKVVHIPRIDDNITVPIVAAALIHFKGFLP